MKKCFIVLFVIISIMTISIPLSAQETKLSLKINNPPVSYTGNVAWGNDLLVSNTEPIGRPSGVVRKSTSVIYVSVPDTNIQTGSGVVILSSSDNGSTWLNIASVTPAILVPRTKMIRSSLDSIYCFFITGSSIYKLNVLNFNLNQVFNGGYRDFDVAASSTGALYIVTDSLANNYVIRYGSLNGGVTWISRGSISSTAANPRIYMSGLGDTLILNYYGPPLTDTAASVIRSVRYRETTPGTLATVGSPAFSNLAESSEQKTQFQSVYYGSKVWFFYCAGSPGNIDLKCKISTNSGSSFTDSTVIGSMPGRDEFWFDAKHYINGSGGVNLIYYSDSLQAGLPTNASDQMRSTTASASAPSIFNASLQFSEHPPVTSAKNFYPTLIQYYDITGDAGALWVGADGSNNKLYFDKNFNFMTLNLKLNLEAISPVQDTVKVLMRNVFAPYAIIDSAKGYLNPTGTVTLYYSNILNGVNYYIVVKHRNSIETWSKSGGEVFSGSVLNYDLTTSAAQAYGSNQILVGSKYSVYTGDVTQEGNVDLTDIITIYNDASVFSTGYINTDLNYDNISDLTDIIFAYNNSANFVVVERP